MQTFGVQLSLVVILLQITTLKPLAWLRIMVPCHVYTIGQSTHLGFILNGKFKMAWPSDMNMDDTDISKDHNFMLFSIHT
jgi:hypothetical protein